MKACAVLLVLLASACASNPSPAPTVATARIAPKPRALVFTGKESCPDLWVAYDDAQHQVVLAEARLDRAAKGRLVRGWLTLGMGEGGDLSAHEREVAEWRSDAAALRAEITRRKCADIPA